MKKHHLKSLIFKFLNTLPSSVGYFCYHQLQRMVERNLSQTVAVNQKSLDKATQMLERVGERFEGKCVLEIGSGWMPLMPYLMLAKAQAKSVYTYDLNAHYSKRSIRKLNRYALSNNWALPKEVLHSSDYLDTMRYYPKTNIISANLPPDVDIVFSRFVLEHITPNDLLAMHEKFANSMPKGTLILHLISPSDHRAFSDSSLSHYDFLRYSKQEWAAIQTKFDYHNRLRLPHYLDIFQQAGLELLHVEYDTAQPGTPKWEKYQAVPIHPDYQSLTDDERTAGSINVLLRC